VSQVPEAGDAAVAPLVWQRPCQRKQKLSVELDFQGSVHARAARTGAELLVPGQGPEVGACSAPRALYFPVFPIYSVFWPGRSELSVPRRLCGSRRLAQRCWVTSGCAPTSIPDPQGSGCLLIRAWMEEGPCLGRGWAREMGGRRAGPG